MSEKIHTSENVTKIEIYTQQKIYFYIFIKYSASEKKT